jgi:hypothetical protein
VLRYLGRYTHGVASNHRLGSFADGKVTFRWRDSAPSNEQKLMTLSLDEFLRCFLLHLLPEDFLRIRNFGFLANRKRATTLPLSFQLLGGAPQTEQEASTAGPSDLWSCPKCGAPMDRRPQTRGASTGLSSGSEPIFVCTGLHSLKSSFTSVLLPRLSQKAAASRGCSLMAF